MSFPQYYIEQTIRDTEARSARIGGWCAAPSHVEIKVRDASGIMLEAKTDRYSRSDVFDVFPGTGIDPDTGFTLAVKNISTKYFEIVFTSEEGETAARISMDPAKIKLEKVTGLFGKTARYIKNNGLAALPGKVVSHIKKTDRPAEYSEWVKHHFADAGTIEKQKQTHFEYEPLLSIVVPLYKTPEKFLNKLINSVKAQSYANWELVLSDGSGEPSPIGEQLLAAVASDERIKVVKADVQHRIAENTNRAIEAASGEFIIFADHDDELEPDALFEVVKALNEDPSLDIIYTDEDKTDENTANFFEPHMKPEFNPDLLRTVNYICHMFVVRKELLDCAGWLRPEFDGAQDYDLILRCTEKSQKIKRIPRVLYHWRAHEASTSEDPESKRYAFEAGKRALQAHFDRLGIKAEVYEGEKPGLYRTRYIRSRDPLISILIPNKDHIEDLKKCMDSLDERSTYRNFEYIIIENNSEKDETFEFYKQLEAGRDNVKVVYYDGGFNFSKINNFGAKYAAGEYLLLLNNDIEMIAPESLEEMLGYCMREDVGAVGARLYYEDDTIQHAGVVIGYGGIAGHCFVMQPRWTTGYMHRIICAQDYSAVTAACMLVDKNVYEKVGGLSEELAVAFNDIDFCMKVTDAGYKVVYAPYAVLYHYESKSRGLEDSPEKKARFNKEIEIFKRKWPDIFVTGDPYYSPNLTLKSQDFSLNKDW